MASEVKYSVEAMPWIRILGELPQPVQYKLMDETEPWQFTASYEGSFGYTLRAGGEELSGLGACAAALKDNYFQLVSSTALRQSVVTSSHKWRNSASRQRAS